MIGSVIHAVGGHGVGTLWASVALIFILGMFLDWLEIVVIALPVLASVLQADDGVGASFASAQLAGCWIGALFALSLQTSFLTPPFGYALLLVHGATSGAIGMAEIWRGALPYVALQLLALGLVAAIPELATWLPAQLLDLSIPKGLKFNE
jgi:TRAP-type mannitol/chloroaromatic compound transport system permease large subunit